ncbi:uncharacterized protein LOC132270213 [Cornus florida]|uniref:uncharacterized protein LOC132270213 n=1 Tax=Cornus florida TaxID=4283 RepID=UPI0028964162|nr:uncharacterized protein LOC132270213 [Cornus florida]
MFLVSHSWARVLFDSGASYSFIALSFVRALGLEASQLDRPLCVDMPVGGSIALSRVCRSCSITITRFVLKFDLILLEMTGFDVILGMDWLSSFRAVIDCFRGRVGQDRQTFFLASPLADNIVEMCGVEYPLAMRDFLDVFPEDLTELPLHREGEFAIDLMPGTAPISMALYRTTPIELKELKRQFDDLRTMARVKTVARRHYHGTRRRLDDGAGPSHVRAPSPNHTQRRVR